MSEPSRDTSARVTALLDSAREIDPTITREAVERYLGEIAAMAADIAPFRIDVHVPVREFDAAWPEDAQPS